MKKKKTFKPVNIFYYEIKLLIVACVNKKYQNNTWNTHHLDTSKESIFLSLIFWKKNSVIRFRTHSVNEIVKTARGNNFFSSFHITTFISNFMRLAYLKLIYHHYIFNTKLFTVFLLLCVFQNMKNNIFQFVSVIINYELIKKTTCYET